MSARKRRRDEDYNSYKENLKAEAKLERLKIKGKWAYRCEPVEVFGRVLNGIPYVNPKRLKR